VLQLVVSLPSTVPGRSLPAPEAMTIVTRQPALVVFRQDEVAVMRVLSIAAIALSSAPSRPASRPLAAPSKLSLGQRKTLAADVRSSFETLEADCSRRLASRRRLSCRGRGSGRSGYRGTEAFRWNEVPRYLIHGRAQRSPSAAFSRNQRALGAALGDPSVATTRRKCLQRLPRVSKV